ncbi:hypothetical protein TpMuguga_04g00863 [Theileria parva strain Muguga]|uniref:Uncharacterized protein n=1 Tax=Theileria parva TaxID=5875 RepID=Q4N186_THEPA|nr:uncharacterized protein TpMuguga_04g00863 [Theileria parva strain Muguga]EAN32217.1 hypothetical protein TpMuguga_04g00863 [Theileria parva strain Muguga]|eukprot:XP_764500.1 hypothetical protein [Theileria parva strain Muguga]
MSNQRKKNNRKYQFDPLSYSSLYHFVSDSVRAHIKKERDKQFKETEWKRSSRRELFNTLSEIQKNFIPPQTSNENDLRALSINKQIAIKTEIKSTLESLQSLVEFGIYKLSKKDELYNENVKSILKEEKEDRKKLEDLRKVRKAKFLERISKESKLVLESREKQRLEAELERKRFNDEESKEESRFYFPSDRKLVDCGLLPPISRITAA